VFVDRADAGRQLARRCEAVRLDQPIVVALPPGGVPVGYEVARALDTPLDVLIVRRLRAGRPRVEVGAVSEGGATSLDRAAVQRARVGAAEMARIAAAEVPTLERLVRAYRPDRAPLEAAHRTVLLVCEGLAAGCTACAAARALRRLRPRRIVLAAPVVRLAALDLVRDEVDEVLWVEASEDFIATGYWYARFDEILDEDAARIVEGARRERRDRNAFAGL
jgi:putative phosphoribosyl transferase